MNEMIERVAKAICASEGGDWTSMNERSRDTCRTNARAAIEAMREATNEMHVAGSAYQDEGMIWHAMIEAALK